jgi:hypothetical protein
MAMRGKWKFGGTFMAAALLAAPGAMAQGAEPIEEKPAAPAAPATGNPDEAAAPPPKAVDPNEAAGEPTEAAKPADATPTADVPAGDSPVELPGQTYRFVGLRYRGIVVPKFMMNLFGDGGETVYVHGVGPEFSIRKDGFEYVFSAWWAGYYMDETPFKASSDPKNAFEVVKSDINVIYLTADFLWSQELGSQFAVNYGMGAGFGFVFGDLFRTQAYPESGNPNEDPYKWKKCTGPGNPNIGDFCGDDNNHYDGYKEASWANGGSKPIIFPWLALQTGFRYKPSKSFVARLDAGFGTSGFFFGVGADYGL